MRRPRREYAPLRRRGLLLVPRLLPLRVPGAPHLHLRARHLRLRGGRREPGQQQTVPPSKCLWVGGPEPATGVYMEQYKDDNRFNTVRRNTAVVLQSKLQLMLGPPQRS